MNFTISNSKFYCISEFYSKKGVLLCEGTIKRSIFLQAKIFGNSVFYCHKTVKIIVNATAEKQYISLFSTVVFTVFRDFTVKKGCCYVKAQ